MIAAAIAFLAGIVCGGAGVVTIFVLAVVRMHKVEQTATKTPVRVTPVILNDSGELN